MAHEIYYTSAPEGIRPGDRGFCTVGATAGIPRRVWDRLEALSGYRHLSDTSTRTGNNPVCHAHWTLNVEGRDYHVLSRICNAGLDYSQRSNALAHHIALEPSELTSAGPAWMLAQPGVMLARWNHHVGEIVRSAPLPQGNISPAPCMSWQRLAGDAGWAGVLAELITHNPWKPICLLFAEDQEVLPLVQEVIALLPPSQRWQATFNTYFTSLPGGVNCQWRCCVAGTPAAVTAIRLAANGLILDLTQPKSLGAPPDTPWVSAARKGETIPLPATAAPKTLAPKPKPARVPPKPAAAPAPATPPDLTPIPLKPLEEPEAVTATPPEVPEITNETEAVDSSTLQPDISWGAEMRRSRRRFLLTVYVFACVAIAAGVWLQIWAYRSSSNQPLPPTSTTRPITTYLPPPPPPVITPVTPTPITPVTPVTPTPPPTVNIVTPPQPTPVTPIPVPPPQAVKLDAPLPSPGAGVGLRDVTRSTALPAARIDNLPAVTTLSIRFPNGNREWPLKFGELDGTFIITPEGTETHPGFSLQWRDSSISLSTTSIATIFLDRNKPQLDFTWRTSVMLRQPQLAGMGYWLLQNSALLLVDRTGQRSQRIEFAPISLKPTSLLEPVFDPQFPADLPLPEHLSLASVTPEGWGGATVPDESRGNNSPNLQIFKLQKPPGAAGIIPQFTIRFSATGRILECDLKKIIAAAQEALAAADNDLKRADTEIKATVETSQPEITEMQQRLDTWKRVKERSAKDPQAEDLTPAQLDEVMQRLTKAIGEKQAELDRQLAPSLARKRECTLQGDGWRSALVTYNELKELELVVELPQGLRVATIPLRRE